MEIGRTTNIRHRRIQDELSNTDITIETLGEPYIINGKLNGILSLISTIPIEIMGRQYILVFRR